ncbi:hypothetical protein JYG23_12395 [Sedimentibacter sp. zth1]|uniref:hypothetical protein n=1 Tax=Sedimentibacter sp. zth1 TaxID=2816908 RepID=UPI001A915C40|nr:hypothetical protein [Sedimentibacter sp. zth1]QSX05468.1 hypothetical protein JYG23_12395 [Sedimentibacter sp. zth1]
MQIHIISDDKKLIDSLKQVKSIKVKEIKKQDISEDKANILVISDKQIDINTLISLKNTQQKCYYLSSKENSNKIEKVDKSLLAVKNIYIVPPKRTIHQIQEYILKDTFEIIDENNVYTFFGADSKVGTTGIIQKVAIDIAKRHPNIKTIVLYLDGQEGFDWIEDTQTENSISDLKVALKNNLITEQNLEDCVYKYKLNLHMLKGEKTITDNMCYSQDEVNNIISLCKNVYDIVLIDAGSTKNIQLIMSYAALINSDNKILVTDQVSRSYDTYKKGKEQILEPLGISNFKFLILNKYINDSILSKPCELMEKYELVILSTLPYIDFHMQAATEKNITLFETEKQYEKGIKNIVEYIEKKKGLASTKIVKKPIFKFFKN